MPAAPATLDKRGTDAKPDQPIHAPVAPVIIGETGHKYYWSSQAHTGQLRGHQTWFEFWRPEWTDLPDEPNQRQAARIQRDSFKRRYTEEEQEILNRAFAKLGTNRIVWNYVAAGGTSPSAPSRTGFVWYATDDDDVAWVIRRDIASGGDGQFIREIPQDTYLQVGDIAYANNDLARKLAFEMMEKTGQSIVPKKKDEGDGRTVQPD